jgi:hypoxanthine phosphoribosyltransferase
MIGAWEINMDDTSTIIDYTYDDFLDGIQQIVSQIKLSGWKPNYIVGIVRGGCVPAVYLSHRLKVPCVMVQWNTRDHTGFGKESNCWIPEDINNGEQVLIVDDIIDGGETIATLIEDWESLLYDPLKKDNIKVAALYYNPRQQVSCDFYHKQIDRENDQRWIHFCWEP